MAEDAGAADLIAGGRLQLGISRGSPEQVIAGWRYFGYRPAEGETDADMGRRHAEVFYDLLQGKGFAQPNPRPMFQNPPGLLRLEPFSEGLRERIWWGSGSNATAVWAAKLGMNLQAPRSRTTRPASLSTFSKRLRSGPSGTPGRRPATRVSRGCRSAATYWRWSTKETAPISDTAVTMRTRFGFIDESNAVDLRSELRRGTGRAYRAAQTGRGDRRGRHAAADRPQPARCGLQRARHGSDPDPRRASARLALKLMSVRGPCPKHREFPLRDDCSVQNFSACFRQYGRMMPRR